MQNTQGATLRQDLMDVLYETNRNEGEFIGMMAMPRFDVSRKAGDFAKIDVDNMIASVGGGKVAPGSKFQRGQREPTTDNFSTEKYGGEEPIAIEDKAELDNYFDVELDAAQALVAQSRLTRESDISSILFDDTTTFASYKTDGSDWTTAGSGTPIDDIRAAVTSLREQVKGFVGGAEIVALVNADTLNSALGTDQVRNALDYGANGFANRDAVKASLAAATGLSAIHDSVLLDASGTAVWTANKFGIYLVSSAGTLRSTPQVGRIFNWTAPVELQGLTSDMDENDGLVVQTYDEVDCDAEIVRVKRYQQVKLLNARAGHVLYGLNA